ncbi:geranylgeranyl reductase family protein [Thalassococcus sp. BH17M4-6]|uniref:geranylgeranyl reductase family protein n=1 Tax=Thalassococcus sp. BH17M4-6 TaxID=3413148 RepID=UPI003BC9C4E9
MSRYDVIVLGAGPGGSAAAVTAARAGLRVALIDKHRFPRNKLCGGGFTGRSMRYFREIFGAEHPDAPMLNRSSVTFCAFGEELGRYSEVPPLYMTMRRTLDHALMQAALDAGAEDVTGATVTDIAPATATVTLSDRTLSADVLIAADGVSSPTARALYGQPFDKRRIGFALEVEHPSDHPARTELRIDFGAAEWGYGWDFPKTCGRTIGVGGVLSRNPDMKANLRRYLAQLGLPDDQPIKGQFLPFGNFRRVPGRGPTLLAGDAAGLVDPITGEGIAFALKSGQEAAQAAIDALAQGQPSTALPRYRNALKPIHAAITQSRLIRPLLFLPTFRHGFIRGFRESSALRQDYLRLLAGETEYSEITRRTIIRLPRHILRAISAKLRADQSPAPPVP